MIGQGVKQDAHGRVVGITQRLVQGSETEAERLLTETQGAGVLNTAFIERLNATLRSRLSLLNRRTRRLGRQPARPEAAVFLLRCVFNFRSVYTSSPVGGQSATPAMLARLTDHVWSMSESLWDRVPPPPGQPPQRRGYGSRAEIALLQR